MTYQIVDWLISYIECFVMLVVVTESGGRKFEEKKQAYLLLSFSLLNAILVAVCNQISAFSFITPVLSIVYNSNFTHPFTRKFSAAYLHKHYDHVCYSNDGVYSYGYILLALWWRSILHSV